MRKTGNRSKTSSETNMNEIKCQDCGITVEQDPPNPEHLAMGMRPWTKYVCDSCQQRRCDEAERLKAEQLRSSQNLELCRAIPPLYRQNDRSLIHPTVLASIDTFDLDSPKGLYLSGPNDHSKTRGACMLLERFCRHGKTIAMVQSTALVELFFQQFRDDGEKAVERLKKLKWADVLLIDDVGKEKATERFETEFFSLLEYRTSHLRKTLYTSNLSLPDLRMTFSKQHGGAIIRRIIQFSKCVEVIKASTRQRSLKTL